MYSPITPKQIKVKELKKEIRMDSVAKPFTSILFTK
jgi:hypothetical protein